MKGQKKDKMQILLKLKQTLYSAKAVKKFKSQQKLLPGELYQKRYLVKLLLPKLDAYKDNL